MSICITIAHDFVCPWCWIGQKQAQKLQKEFGVEIDWRGYQLFPDELEWPEPSAPTPENPDRPKVPNRLDLMLKLEDLTYPSNKFVGRMRTHNAHEAVEFAKTLGKADEMIEALYDAYWLNGIEIDKIEHLTEVVRAVLGDPTECMHAVANKQFAAEIVGFDDPAYAKGVYNVPTFWIDGKRYAEQPYIVLSAAVKEMLATPV